MKVSKTEFIIDLERLEAGTLSIPDFQNKYLFSTEVLEIEGVTEKSAPNLLGNLGHLISADDPRDSDEFKSMQKAELRKLIQLLRAGASPKDLDEISFLGNSDAKVPGLGMRIFVGALVLLFVGLLSFVLKRIYQ